MKVSIVGFPLIVCFLLALIGLSCDQPYEAAVDSEDDFLLFQDSIVVFDGNAVDTLRLKSNLDLSVDKLEFTSQNIRIISLQHIQKNDWQMVLADREQNAVYAENSYLVYSDSIIHLQSNSLAVRKPFFTHFAVVSIETPEKKAVVSKTEWMDSARITIYDKLGYLQFRGNTAIKGRGNSTWNAPKKPYALKLDHRSELFGMPAHRRWILLANYMDKTLLRNHIAFCLAKAEGTALDWTPIGVFVDLLFNGVHQGCYYLCEQITIDEHRVNVHKNNTSDTAGGFLLEWDIAYDEVNRFRTPLRDLPVMIKEPDEDELTSEQFHYIEQYIANTESLLYAKDYQNTRLYEERLDINS